MRSVKFRIICLGIIYTFQTIPDVTGFSYLIKRLVCLHFLLCQKLLVPMDT